MTVNKLEVKNFRNIKNLEIEPDRKTNVFCGPNAQGKTNLLEALWLFTGAKSFRGAKENEFISFGESEAKLTLQFSSHGVNNDAVLEIKDREILREIFALLFFLRRILHLLRTDPQ